MALPKSLQPPKKSPLANAASGPPGNGGSAAATDPYTAQAMAEIQPIIDQLSAAANQQATASSTAIQGLTDSYAKELAGLNLGAPYQNAEAGQAAVDAALQQSLTGGGASLAQGLSSELAALKGSSGEGALNQAAGQLSSLGASGGNARLASGSASLGNLIANGAAAETYGKKLPGIADLSGLQGVKQAEGNAQAAIRSGTLSLESQLPGIEQQLRSDKLAQQSLKAERQYRAATLGLSSAKARAAIMQGNARIGIAQQNANNTAAHDRALEKLAVANYGLSAGRLQLAQYKATQIKRTGGLTANEYGSLRQKAASDLQGYYHGVAAKYEVGPNGTRILVSGTGPGSAKTYQAAIKGLILSYPQLGPKQIIKMADQLYKPGEGGRPQSQPGMMTGLLQGIFGGAPLGGRPSGGAANYGRSQGVGADVGQAIGGASARSTNADGFLPTGVKFTYDRHDQGRDIQTTAGAPITAPGDGYVVRWGYDPGGGGGHFGPKYPIVHFTSGPYAGRDVYIGHTVAALKPGQRFRAGAVLSRTQQSGPSNGGAPSGWAEIGFAPGGTPGAFDQPAPF